jgi:hypothetical protein
MRCYALRFNLYLLAGLLLLAVTGCQSEKSKAEKAESKKLSALRVHVETKDDGLGENGTTSTILFPRTTPVTISIAREPILLESDTTRAVVMASPGGFSIEVQFNEMGALTLEQFTAANPGKHLVIFGQWDDPGQSKPRLDPQKDAPSLEAAATNSTTARWLAAPLITHRISDGLLSFTPDCSLDEAKRFVLGLNNVAKKVKKGDLQ